MFRIDFNKLRFLVCDDNPHMRRILRTLLHSFGAREVYESEDGATALEMYSHYVPDIVITDWSMPIFDGLELAQMIRQPESKGNPYAPIIMLTGHSEKRRVTVARDAGVTEFLAKPISAKGLYQRILNVVANPRPFIKTKTYFGPDRRRNTASAYIGPERRIGGEVEVQQHRLALVGQQHLPAAAPKQARSQMLLEVPDPLAYGAMRHVHFPRRVREVQVTGSRFEEAKRLERWKCARHSEMLAALTAGVKNHRWHT